MGFQNPYGDDSTIEIGLIALVVIVAIILGIGWLIGKFL